MNLQELISSSSVQAARAAIEGRATGVERALLLLLMIARIRNPDQGEGDAASTTE